MNELVREIRQTLEHSDFLQRAFPALHDWGIRDEDILMHSVGCSVWNTLGHELGFMAVVEAPAPLAVGNDIRSDSTWFRYEKWQPLVLVEFERYDGTARSKAKLEGKLSNLMEAAIRWGRRPRLLVLSAWSKGVVSAPDMADMVRKLRTGFKNNKGVAIQGLQGSVLLFNRFIFDADAAGLLRLQRMTFWEAV